MSASSFYDSYRVRASEAGPEVPDFDVQYRDVVDINDNNQGNYQGGQIVFDLNQLVSSDYYLDWGSSYMTIPLKMTATGTVGNPIVASASNLFGMCLKGSNLAIINSINLTCNNQQLVGNTQLSNIPLNWKLVSSFNQNDVDVLGKTLNFQKDSSRTFQISANSGEINNNPSPYVPIANDNGVNAVDAPYQLYNIAGFQNQGMYNRCLKQSYSSADPNFGNVPGTCFNSYNALGAERVNVCTTTPPNADTNNTVTWTMFIQIPMKFMHDVFDKCPLTRGALWQMTITTHLPCSFTATVTTTGVTHGTQAWVAPMTATNQNQFTPFMVAMPGIPEGGTVNQGTAGLNITANKASAGFAFTAQIGFGNTGNPLSTGSVCTMHAVTYKLSPTANDRYMRAPRKRIVFEDFIRSSPAALNYVAPTSTVQANITPGTAKVRGLLICPYLPATANGGNGTQTGVSALTSALTPCGATVTPYYFLDNFQVTVGGRAIWPKNLLYKYDAYFRELFGINCPNGNGVTAMRAGLIDEDDFNAGYGFIYVNLERHLASADDLPVSVDIQFQNTSPNYMSFNAFLFFEKDFNLDCTTGKILA